MIGHAFGIAVCLLILEACRGSHGANRCGPDEVYSECGSACPETCATLGHHQLCTDGCVGGCFCKGGFVKDDNGICIQRSQCPAVLSGNSSNSGCGKDEEHYDCIPTCRNTCDNYNATNPICALVCIPGCFCRRGWVKDRDEKCVPTCQCDQKPVELQYPPTCGEDEVYYESCAPSCGGTCGTYDKKDIIRCQACKPGCWCKEGLVKNQDGKCVPTTQCEKSSPGSEIQTCGLNEEFKSCGSACPTTCSSLADRELMPFCPQRCVPGCFCKEGFVTNDDGQCVHPTRCSNMRCGENEVYENCGSACPVTCADKDKDLRCTQQCTIGCVCKKGYVRNSQWKCIPPDQCPSDVKECSGLNEVMVDCAKPKSCNTCEIRGNCKLKTCRRGCDCKPGYYRNSAGVCYPEAQCTDDSGVNDCNLPPDVGPCSSNTPRFYFDNASGKCRYFNYGGCQGNANNFRTEQECNRKCGKQKVEYDCDKEPVKGSCRGDMPRLYFDSKSGECKRFIYGGCGGNKNNFRTRDECSKKCGESPKAMCDLSPDKGPCRSLVSRFYFDRTSGTCETFSYGGCKGNRNNFPTEDECYRLCGEGSSERPDCFQAPDSGPCKSLVPRFYFEMNSGTCKSFNYGGCDGNTNNFKTQDECQRKCGNSPAQFDCDKKSEVGPCRGNESRFFYDSTEGVCKRFVYGGCGGNRNNFRTKEECNNKCGSKLRGSCDELEVYKECGSACPRTCRNLTSDVKCIDRCVKGCFCKDGFVRNDQGSCIQPDRCPVKEEKCDGENEAVVDCVKPTWCNTCGVRGNCKLSKCETGCDCKPDHYRNDSGVCVPASQCPEEECNGENEALVDCVKPPWCNTCGIKGNCKLSKCEKGCDCKPDHYRNDSGVCVPAAQCPGFCPLNEEYSECVNPCNDCETRGKCNFLVCNKGCDCKKEYHRDGNNACVPASKCPVKGSPQEECKEDEEPYDCAPDCQNTCENYNRSDVACPAICRRGCFCKKGLVKRSDGKCVAPSECEVLSRLETSPKCGTDEVYYDDCAPSCGGTCDTKDGTYNCPLCRPGCWCKKGMVKNSAGKCVLPTQCDNNTTSVMQLPPKCGKDEIYYDKCAPTCGGTCDTYDKKDLILCLACEPGCWCRDGMVKNKDGKCVTTSQCDQKPTEPSTPVCSANEKYYPCIPTCRNTCDNYKAKNPICARICIKGCFCKQGWVKNKEEQCVPTSQCPQETTTEPETSPKCGTDEVYYDDCAPSCGGTCDTKDGTYNCPLCRPGCWCKKGMVKNSAGKCVLPTQCDNNTTSEQCGENEKYDTCGTACPETCANKGTDEKCTQQCTIGCFCNDGYVRNDQGKCIPTDQCPSEPPEETCGPLEQYYDCVPNCHNTCETYNKTNTFCPFYCRRGCFCRTGLVLRKDNQCVPSSECFPPTEQCGENEVYDTCGTACPETCADKDDDVVCPQLCEIGCFCKKGYVRNDLGKCIPKDQCPSDNNEPPTDVCSANEEYYQCRPTCRNTCDNYKAKNPICPRICIRGCYCKQGWVKNKEGECVPTSQCPQETTTESSTQLCSANEEYYPCIPTCRNTCDNYKAKNPICARICIKGCFCKQGWVKNEEGECVPTSQCPQETTTEPSTQVCSANEEYYPCIPTCRNTCDNYKAKNPICARICIKGCFCKQGWVKNKEGECVPTSQCPQETTTEPSTQVCSANEEYYPCIPTCRNTCDNYKAKNPICAMICIKGCFCKKGWVKNEEGECVPTSECPQETTTEPDTPPKCGTDEVYYDDCAPSCGGTCDTKDGIHLCPLCRPGCWCKEGMFKNSEGKCVPPMQCDENSTTEPSTQVCSSDEEFYQCIPTCHNSCDNYKAKNPICPLICIKGCFCKQGWVKNKEGECIPTSQCPQETTTEPDTPPKCSADEVYYDDCAPSCGGTCDTKDGTYNCPLCRPGCWCEKGMVKNREGKCVPPTQCDEPLTDPIPNCPKNQEYSLCIPSCKRTCMTYNSTAGHCPRDCIRGCFCKDGLVMNKDGDCIPPEQCPENCNFTQQYYDCMPDCQNRCTPLEQCPPEQCRPGCFCRPDLVLREDGLCVRKELCGEEGKPKCGKDKQYYDCYSRCNNSCESQLNGKQVACPAICEKGCFCKRGMVVDADGNCVTPDQCEAEETTTIESTVELGVELQRRRRENRMSEQRTNDIQTRWRDNRFNRDNGYNRWPGFNGGRFGNRGFNRNPGVNNGGFNRRITCRANEILRQCATPNRCETCDVRGNCDLDSCVRGCDCVTGHYRNAGGVCIPESRCPNTEEEEDEIDSHFFIYPQPGISDEKDECGDNEHVVDCAKPRVCNSCLLKGNCSLFNCSRGCDCLPGFFRNDDSVCVPESDCPVIIIPPQQECRPDEVYNECGSDCPETCENYGQTQLCSLQCVLGCFCRKGLVRNARGECIPPALCQTDDRRSVIPRPPSNPIPPRRRPPPLWENGPEILGSRGYSWEVLDLDSDDIRFIKSQSKGVVYFEEISESQNSDYEEYEE